MLRILRNLLAAFALTLLVACGDDDVALDAGGVDAAADATADAPDANLIIECVLPEAPARVCTPADTNYAPGADDMWPACISDSGEYERVQETISTIQRVAAFEQIVDLLVAPDSDAYLMARQIYQQEEGLDSRVVRRYDPRVAVPEGTDCTQAGVPEEFPDRCVGPATLQPILLDAFATGINDGGSVSAERIEAALLRFLYVSVFKEATTCTTTAKDCDSAYAYYTGGEAARGGIGLAADIAEVAPDAHDRVWDGLLALRCWRDLDPAESAEMLELRDRAIDQIDRGLSDGVAALVRSHLSAFCDGNAEEWAHVSVLGPALLISARARGTAEASVMEAEFAKSAAEVDVEALTDAIDALFPCP